MARPDDFDGLAAWRGARWLRLGLAAALGLVAGATLFATEAQGTRDGRRAARGRRVRRAAS